MVAQTLGLGDDPRQVKPSIGSRMGNDRVIIQCTAGDNVAKEHKDTWKIHLCCQSAVVKRAEGIGGASWVLHLVFNPDARSR